MGISEMRVAYLDSTGQMGGAEHLLLSLLDGLKHRGIDLLLICGEKGPFPEKARQHNIPTEVMRLPPFRSVSWVIHRRKIFNPLALAWNILLLLYSAWQIRKRLLEAQVDIVQTNTAFSHIYGCLGARLAGIPCIWYFHDLVETDRLAGSVAFFWKILALGLTEHIVTVSKAVEYSLGLDSRSDVIYAGYGRRATRSFDVPLRDRLGLSNEARLVGFVGRIARVKALEVLAQSAARVVQEDPRVHFVLFGAPLFSGEGYQREVSGLVEALKLESHWHWLGYDDQAVDRIPEFDFVVLPSRREALPLVLLEAGLASKAVVASRVGGIPEVIIDGETGLIVRAEDIAELTAAMLKLIRDPKLSEALGHNACQRIEHLFAPQRYYQEFMELYSLIGETGAD